MKKKRNTGGDRLLGFLERIERLEVERRQLASDVKDVFAEAKGVGFDPKVMRQMLRERKMSDDDRAEWASLCETYRAALGMLDGTPLGTAARRRFGDDSAEDDAAAEPAAPDATAQPTADDVVAARAQGAEAARTGIKVTDNPYAFDDARRAAWDEGWCREAGSDGMELPPAWRRSKPGKGDGKGDGSGGGA